MEPRFDFVVVGAGPAGLQAALILGRARRWVLLCDSGEPRNAVSGVVHGFLSRDGIDPAKLGRLAVEELRRYPTVELRPAGVEAARPMDGGFGVTLADGLEEAARKLILATGVVDVLPPIAGLEELWGRAAFHCAYCDAFERSDQPIAVIESAASGWFYALQLGRWSADVVLCTNGPAELAEEACARLSARDISVRTEAIARLEANGDGVGVVFSDGPSLARQVIFIRPPTRQRSDLAAQLGCNALEDGSIEVTDLGHTSVPGVYAAGDMARRPRMPFPSAGAIIAASAGGIAAVAADRELLWA